MKKITNLKGVKAISKKEQKSISGGRDLCTYCGWSIPHFITCFSPSGGTYNIPCDERLIKDFHFQSNVSLT